MMSRRSCAFFTTVWTAGVCHAETEAGYIFIGLIASLPSFVFFSLLAWLMYKHKEDTRASIGIMLAMLVFLIPLGFNVTFYGAIYPNWIAYGLDFNYQILPDLILAAFFMLQFFIQNYFSRNSKVPRSPSGDNPDDE